MAPDERTTVTVEAEQLRAAAEAGPIGKRQSSMELYRLLASCMALGKRCMADQDDRSEMRRLVSGQGIKGQRRYVEAQSHPYLLVTRYVFHNLKSSSGDRSNASRYAKALLQADKMNLGPNELAKFMWDNGGVNALYLSRPLDAATVTTKFLHLKRSVTVPKQGTITLKLRRTIDNRYEVLEESTDAAE